MAFSPANEFQEFAWNLIFRGVGSTSTSNRLILLRNTTLSATSTAADAIAGELLNADGYTRGLYSPGAAATSSTTTDFPDSSIDFTNGGASQISYDSVAMVYGASATANNEIASIASSIITINAHSLSIGDKVCFTNSTSSAPSGITLSTAGTATVYFVVSATTNTFQISATSGGSAISLGSSWTGDLYCRYANGVLVGYDPESSAIAIEPSQTSSVNVRDFSLAPSS